MDEQRDAQSGPVGQGNYTVKQGDCIESIAKEHGLFWEAIWNHPKNEQLRSARKDPNVLLAGDKVFVPEKEVKEEPGGTEERHRFQVKGTPGRLRLRVLDEEQEPRANAPYALSVDGRLFSGKLDAAGMLNVVIPPNARSGRLVVGTEPDTTTYELQLGHLDPLDTVSGVQARLNDLGFFGGEIDGKLSEITRDAIQAFQEKYELTVDGKPGPEMRKKLEEVYGR